MMVQKPVFTLLFAAAIATISSDVKTTTRWKDRLIAPAKPDYILTRDLALTAELTVNPGVTAALERNLMLNLQNGATLTAKGFPENRIQFTGVKAERGYWAGIANYSPSTANALAFVDLAFTGSRGGIQQHQRRAIYVWPQQSADDTDRLPIQPDRRLRYVCAGRGRTASVCP